jgi:hypothetical protein
MDILHAQLGAIQHKLAFVQVEPIDWKTYVLLCSWGICLFESYLLYVLINHTPWTLTVINPLMQPAAISTLFKANSARRPCGPLYTSGV